MRLATKTNCIKEKLFYMYIYTGFLLSSELEVASVLVLTIEYDCFILYVYCFL